MTITREEISNSSIQQLLAPMAINAARSDIAAVDTSGFESMLFSVLVGTSAVEPSNENNLQVKLAHSDNNQDFETCDASQIVTESGIKPTSAVVANISTLAATNQAYGVSYIGHRRFVKPVIIANGNLEGEVQVAITAILHNPKYRPTLRLAVNNLAPGRQVIAQGVQQGVQQAVQTVQRANATSSIRNRSGIKEE